MINLIKKIKDSFIKRKGSEKTLTSDERTLKVKHQDMNMTQMSFIDEYLQDVREIELEMNQKKTSRNK